MVACSTAARSTARDMCPAWRDVTVDITLLAWPPSVSSRPSSTSSHNYAHSEQDKNVPSTPSPPSSTDTLDDIFHADLALPPPAAAKAD